MKTVQKNSTITMKKLQQYIEKNIGKLGLTEDSAKKIIKAMRSKYVNREMRTIFYQECLKRVEGERKEPQRKYNRLNKSERVSIEILYSAGFCENFIAIFLNRARSTINRELEKNVNEYWNMNSTKSPYNNKGQENIKYYSSEQAQKKYEERKKRCRKKKILEKSPRLLSSIKALLRNKEVEYSPEIIAHLSQEGKIKDAENRVCANTIYSAIYEGIGGLSIADMPHKMRYYKKPKNVHTLTKPVSEKKTEYSIEKIPEGTRESETYFEGDSIVGVRNGTHNTLITIVNKASQFTFIKRSENKTAKATVLVLDELEKELPNMSEIVKVILWDNGIEFSSFEEMMKSVEDRRKKRFRAYFAHPYASYERGSNENKNRMIRRTFKKGKAVETLSDEDILNIARKINNMPRKALGYRTPLEVFEENLRKKNIDTKFLNIYRVALPKCVIA